MKKLMTMIAAAAMAFGLYATEEFKAGTCFNEWTDISDRTGDENLTWSASLYQSTLINPAGWSFGKKVLPKRWADNDAGNALNVKTALGTEFVTCAPTSAIVPEGDEKIYVDTLVKFTAFDEEAQFEDATAKLAIWIKEETGDDGEPTGVTNLYVTAGKIDEGVNITPENYLVGEYKGGDWCRLTIKSLGSVKGDGTGVYGFVVYVDGEPVGCTTDKGFGYVTLSDLAAYYNANNILFPSLIKGTEISSLAISGQGAIDDIAFTTEAPDFAVDMLKATITLDGVTAAQLGTITVSTNDAEVSGVDLSSGSASIYYKKTTPPNPPTIKVEWTGAGDVLAGEAESSTGALTIDADDLTHANVYIGSKGYETIAAALVEAQANDTITLSNDVEEVVTIATAVTLDLAGKVLTGNVTANANLTIANSDASRIDGGKKFNGQIVGTVTRGTGDIIIRGGYIQALAGSYVLNGILIYAGQFGDLDPFDESDGLGTPAEGVTSAPIPSGIWEAGEFVAQINTAKYLTLAEAAADAKPGDTVQLIADVNLDATAVFQGTGTNTEAIVLDFNGKTVTAALSGSYGIVIADANVKFTGTGTFNVKEGSSNSASLVMVGVADSAGSAGKPGSGSDQFIGRLVVDGNISFMGGTDTSCCIRQENGYCEIKNGTFDAVAKEGTKKTNSIKASANTGVVTEALISGGTFEIPFATKGEGSPAVWPSMQVEGGKFKTVPTDVTGITIKDGCKLKLNTEDGYYYVTPIQYATLAITYDTTIFSDVSVTNAAGVAVEAGQIDIDYVSAAVANYTLDTEKYELDPTSVLAVGPFVQDQTFTIELKATAKQTDPIPVPPVDTPEAVSNALEEAGIPAGNPVYKTVTTKADVQQLNGIIAAAGGFSGDAATAAAQKANLNSTFLMDSAGITPITKLWTAEASIVIDSITATDTAGTYEFVVEVKEGSSLVELQQAGAQALANKVLVGNAVTAINSKVAAKDLSVKAVVGGKAVFTIAYGNGAAGFMKVNVDKTVINE